MKTIFRMIARATPFSFIFALNAFAADSSSWISTLNQVRVLKTLDFSKLPEWGPNSQGFKSISLQRGQSKNLNRDEFYCEMIVNTDSGISKIEADEVLEVDTKESEYLAEIFPFRSAVIIRFAHRLGLNLTCGFQNHNKQIEIRDVANAVKGILELNKDTSRTPSNHPIVAGLYGPHTSAICGIEILVNYEGPWIYTVATPNPAFHQHDCRHAGKVRMYACSDDLKTCAHWYTKEVRCEIRFLNQNKFVQTCSKTDGSLKTKVLYYRYR